MNETSTPPADEGVWDRLRRRKLVQWGVAYAAGAWGFQQGVAYVSTLLDWPVQVQRLTGLALLIVLPIALVLAWYHGDRGQRQVTRSELAILTLLFLLGGGVFWYFQLTSETSTVAAQPPPGAAALATDRSIAVLPFVNMSPDKDQEYFADGTSEELLNVLAQVPGLRVIARTSSFSFKGSDVDIAEIARRLNVAHVLEGSVRKSGDKLRITAQLVRASDSSHLWSQTFDRHATDIFSVQDEIARAVVEQLKIKLGVAPKVLATDPQAYALFLQGREVARQFSQASFEQAIDLYQQALAIDPAYAPAWDGLADTYFNQMDFVVIPFDQGLPLAREAIMQTLKSDAEYAPAYARLALVEGVIELDLASGARHIERGLELDPANLEVINAAVFMAWTLQRFDHGIALGRYVVSRDPVNEVGHDRLALTYLSAGRLEEALEEFRIVLKLKPTFGGEHYYVGLILLLQGDAEAALAEIQQEHMESWRLPGLVMAYYQLGRRAESDAALEKVINKYGKAFPHHVAYALTYRGETDRAFELLEQADVRTVGVGIMARHAILAPLHSDPRWLPFLQRTGLAPEQLAAIKFDVKVPN